MDETVDSAWAYLCETFSGPLEGEARVIAEFSSEARAAVVEIGARHGLTATQSEAVAAYVLCMRTAISLCAVEGAYGR